MIAGSRDLAGIEHFGACDAEADMPRRRVGPSLEGFSRYTSGQLGSHSLPGFI